MKIASWNNKQIMSNKKVLVLGICGATCSGKTTTAQELHKLLPNSRVFGQDEYYFDVEDPRHTWIPELNHINFDIVSSLDMARMLDEIKQNIEQELTLIKAPEKITIWDRIVCFSNLMHQNIVKIKESGCHVVIIEGFCILNYKPLADICDLKYYFTLDYEECFKRRLKRVYEPPDCPGYFEKCAWPEHLQHVAEVKKTVGDVTYFNENTTNHVEIILNDLAKALKQY